MIFKVVYWLESSDLLIIMLSDEWQGTLLMISQYGSGYGLLLLAKNPLFESMLTQF